MYRLKNGLLPLLVLTVSMILLAACGAVHIPEVSQADRQGRMDEIQTHLTAEGTVAGDSSRGKNIYMQMCRECHGDDGRDENFGEQTSPEYLGTVAATDPVEFFEISNFGDEERRMPGFYDDLTLEQLVNILAYAQTLPAK